MKIVEFSNNYLLQQYLATRVCLPHLIDFSKLTKLNLLIYELINISNEQEIFNKLLMIRRLNKKALNQKLKIS